MPSHKGQKRTIRNIKGGRVSYIIEDEIIHREKGYPEKAIYLQKLRFEDGSKMLRFCYYIIGSKPKMKGKWVYGQAALMTLPEDIEALLKKAKRRKFF